MDDISKRISDTRHGLGLTQEEFAELLEISAQYVSLLEGGKRQPSTKLITKIAHLETQHLAEGAPSPLRVLERSPGLKLADRQARMIPLVSWAHAGEAQSYEELPKEWQGRVASDSTDAKAFAVTLVGDSMAKEYLEGDVLIVEPGREPFSGCLAVVRLANDGILFRRVEIRGERFILVPLNTQYRIEEFSQDEVSWVYPVRAMIRAILK